MFRSLKMSSSCKIILSSSVPSKREGLDVVQLCAVMIGRPVSLSRLVGEAVSVSLCTFGRSFIYGSCSLSFVTVSSSCLLVGVESSWLKRS